MTYLRRSLSIAAFATLAATCFAATPLTSLVNDQTSLVVSIHDAPTLIKNWDQSPWAKTWNDEQMKKFLGPLRTEMKVDTWDETCKRETGYTVRELLSLAKGDALIALTNLAAAVEKPDSKEPPILVAVDVGDNEAAIQKLLTQTPTDKAAVNDETEEFSGVTVHVRKQTSKEGAETTVWAFVDGTWLLSPSKDSVIAAIDGAKKGGVDNPLSQSEGFLRVMKKAGENQFMIFANVQAIYPILQKEITAKAGAQPNPMGVDPASILPTLGIDAIREIYICGNIGEDATEMNSGMTFSESRGILKMISNSDGPVVEPNFVPEKWLQVSSLKYSLRTTYATLEEMLENFSPAISGMVQGQIKGMNKRMGLDLKRDLIGSIGDTVITAQSYRSVPDASSHLLDQFFAVSLDNPDAFNKALETLKLQFGPQAEKIFVKRDYLGYTIYNVAMNPSGPAAASYAYAVAKNYFFLSIGSAQPIEAALQGLAGDQPSFWSRKEVKQALADFPSEATAVSFSDFKAQIPGIIDAIAKSAEALAKASPPEPKDDADDNKDKDADAPPALKRTTIVDDSAKPDPEAIGKYWSYASGYATHDSNGVYYKSKMIHPK